MDSPFYAARVKSILSGDSVILTPIKPSGKTDGNPQERIISLPFVTSYTSQRKENDEYEDSVNFEAREYLRQRLLNKEIRFKVYYKPQNSDREYGNIYVSNSINLLEKMTEDGKVKLRSGLQKYEEGEFGDLIAKLKQLEKYAEDNKLGLWSNPAKIKITNPISKEFIDENKGKFHDAIVERVFSGDGLLVRILFSPTQHVIGTIHLAGIKVPKEEPIASIAKQFVETRLLQRSVKVKIVTISSQNIVFGDIVHPAGHIEELLLQNGLGEVADWQSEFVGSEKMLKLRAAEKAAKAKGLNIWKSAVSLSKPNSSSGSKGFEASIIQIVSSDTLIVRPTSGPNSNKELTIRLASLRSPRPSDQSQAPFVQASKEYVRKLLIGKRVQVEIIGKREKTDTIPEIDVANVSFHGKDVGLNIVSAGYASVLHHRKDDTLRSPIWDELIEESVKASKIKIGIYSEKKPDPDRTVDASESGSKAKAFINSLTRQKKHVGVVDFVMSGSRARISIPRENLKLTFVIGGIRVPRFVRNPSNTAANSSTSSEPFGKEAYLYANRKLMQRDVEIEVADIDRSGAFIGIIRVIGSKENFAISLLHEGFAEVNEFSAERLGLFEEFSAAEKVARDAHKGIWSEQLISERNKKASIENAQKDIAPEKKEYFDVTVKSVSDIGDIKLAKKSASNAPKSNNGDIDAELSYIAFPPQSTGFLDVALEEFKKFVGFENNNSKKVLVARVDYVLADGKRAVTLYDPENSSNENDSINSELVASGYAYVIPKKLSVSYSEEITKHLLPLEDQAKVNHWGCWYYGDFTDYE